MKIMIGKFNLILIGLSALIFGWAYIFTDLNKVSNGWEYRMAIFSTILVVYYIVVWKCMRFAVVSPKFFVLLSLWLFHISLVIVMGFNLHEYNKYIMLYRYGEQNSCNALFFSNMVIIFYVFGLIVSSKKNRKLRLDKDIDSAFEAEICRKVGITLFLLSLLPTLYSNYVQISAKIADGYTGTMSADTSFHGIPLGWFTKMFLPSILLLMASYKNDKKKCLRVMIPTLIYYIAFMFFTGRKGNTIQTIVPILIIYFYYFKPKIRIFNIVIVYLGIYIVTIVTKTRSMSVDANFWIQLKAVIKETSPISDLMLEMGGTIKSVIQMQLAVPKTGTYLFGITYIFGVIFSILNTGLKLNVVMPLAKYSVFAEYLAQPQRGKYINDTVVSMGGSCIAEWWWNFGWFTLIFVLVFAKLVLLYEERIENVLYNPTKFAMWCSFLYYLMRYTRGYVTDMVWDPIFIFLCISFMYKYFKSRVRSGECNYEGNSISNCTGI
ncbi:O-antigen polysaccharide polymerase Wzy [Clostridium manihotivorum]|nr:O-antigen polysaccharide polymerase Wzy [Clostridium manihotivorum]